MESRKKILMVSCSQFGYHTDMLKYSEYLSENYKIYYLCKDQNQKKIRKDEVDVRYVEEKKNKIIDRFVFFKLLKKYINECKPDYILVDYFFACLLINFISPGTRNILDFRTGAIGGSSFKRTLKNSILTFESRFFKNCIVISQGLKELLSIKSKNVEIIPIGADRQVEDSFIKGKISNEVNLFYVGVLTGRRIIDTLVGFEKFIGKHSKNISCHYSIVGYGKDKKDEQEIIDFISSNNLQEYIKFYGRVENNKLKSFFETNNIGVSYVPLYDYYQVQPPTKTFEYLKNGMICIATDTIENRRVINEENGVLTEDNSESFYLGLEKIYKNINNYDKKIIYDSVDEYSWNKIVEKLDAFLRKL